MNLCRYEIFEREVVGASSRPCSAQRTARGLCFLNGSHLVQLARELGWRVFAIAADGKLTEISESKLLPP